MSRRSHLSGSAGQALVEFAIVFPMVLVLALGVVEIGFALYDAHVVTRLAREGANLISRDTSPGDAAKALKAMNNPPVNFDDGSSKVIFSVIKKGGTTGTSNFNKDVLYQRYEYGSCPGASTLTTRGAGSFTGVDNTAANSDTDTNLQVTNLPPGTVTAGGMIYITEVFSKHTLITPIDRFGVTMPRTLYSIAYF